MVHIDDKEKTAISKPWWIFMYAKMPFGLMDVGTTLQRDMDISFDDENDKFVVIYLNDITIFSKSNNDHLNFLNKVFLKCRKYAIFLIPKSPLSLSVTCLLVSAISLN